MKNEKKVVVIFSNISVYNKIPVTVSE